MTTRLAVIGAAVILSAACVAEAAGILYISDRSGNNKIMQYDAASGEVLGSFSLAAGQSNATYIALTPDQSILYVQTSTGIQKYDRATGSYLGALTSTSRRSFTLGHDGTVYVADANAIYTVNPDGSQSLWKQLSNNAGDPVSATTISYDGKYWMGYYDPSGPDRVMRVAINLDGTAGAQGDYHTGWTNTNYAPGILDTSGAFFLTDGPALMFTTSGPTSGGGWVLDSTLAGVNSTGMLAVGPDGKVYYMANGTAIKRVDSYNPAMWTGTVSTFITSGKSELSQGFGLAFYVAPLPEPATLSLLVLGGLAAVIRRRRK